MKRRDVEGDHAFAKCVAEQCQIFELGGLLLDKNWNFTAAVEAFELSSEEKGTPLSSLLDRSGYAENLFMSGLFAQKLNVPFYIIAHVQDESIVRLYSVHSDHNSKQLLCSEHRKLTEDDFIRWWQEMKGTVQTKPYRKDLKDRAKSSYFDNLLESNGLKWGGNIDGYLVSDSSDASNMIAVIENRFTRKIPLNKYDPNAFYSGYNGGDYNTWLPLMKLKDRLGIPLFLMTYSHRSGEENKVGITQILGQSKTEGLQYIKDTNGAFIRPCDNIVQSVSDVKKWFEKALKRQK